MSFDLKSLTADQLKSLIANYERKGETKSQTYVEAVSVLDSKVSPGLDLKTTVKILVEAAKTPRFISYGEVAEANSSNWQQVRRLMPTHLDNVLSYCHQRHLPYLTAIVVSKPNLTTGRFDPENLRGFVNGLRRLGLSVTNPEEFAQAEQTRVFNWAKEGTVEI